MSVNFTELDQLEATFYDNPGDPVVMGVIADWLDEHGFEKMAFAYRWGAKFGKWPVTSDRERFLWNRFGPDGSHSLLCGSIDTLCDNTLTELWDLSLSLPFGLEKADGVNRSSCLFVMAWQNPLRAGMYALGEALNMKEIHPKQGKQQREKHTT